MGRRGRGGGRRGAPGDTGGASTRRKEREDIKIKQNGEKIVPTFAAKKGW